MEGTPPYPPQPPGQPPYGQPPYGQQPPPYGQPHYPGQQPYYGGQPPYGQPPPKRRQPVWLFVMLAALLAGGAATAIVLLVGSDESKAQTLMFQEPTDPGRDTFTPPADVRGRDTVKLPPEARGPFGGTGSDLVCDRELLIRALRARPDRLREWARVLGVTPTGRAVASYIRRLRPVTLVRDTRVTNHYFVAGRAIPYQAILQAGTAVLVDSSGVPVVRCRCGNPLLEPIYIRSLRCVGCPPHYTPPPPCEDYADCYRRYPHPPTVIIIDRRPRAPEETRPPPQAQPPPAPTPAPAPDVPESARFFPRLGTPGDTFTLSVSGFEPGRTLSITLTRPSGVVESYSLTTGGNGSGSYTFHGGPTDELGTYTATITDPNRPSDQASASTTVVGPD